MLHLSKLATQLVTPLDLALLLAALGVGLAFRGRARVGAALVAVAALGLWAASVPVVAVPLMHDLESRFAEVAPEDAPMAGAIVLLGGGLRPYDPARRLTPQMNAAGDRLLEAARLYRAGKAPLVIATGAASAEGGSELPQAEAAARLLVEAGVPREAIVGEPRSRTTWEDARYVKELLDARGIGDVLLVTSALHMPRALAAFERFGVRAIPVPSDFEADAAHPGSSGWLPDVTSLDMTTNVLEEYEGTLVYALRARLQGVGAR